MTTWSRGRQTNHLEVTLPFDPATGFHEYTIEYGRQTVAFRVDGVLVGTFSSQLPRKSMKLLANAWWPTWLIAQPSPADASMEIDRIEIR
jgi:beta-glucanase (GH16 family)